MRIRGPHRNDRVPKFRVTGARLRRGRGPIATLQKGSKTGKLRANGGRRGMPSKGLLTRHHHQSMNKSGCNYFFFSHLPPAFPTDNTFGRLVFRLPNLLIEDFCANLSLRRYHRSHVDCLDLWNIWNDNSFWLGSWWKLRIRDCRFNLCRGRRGGLTGRFVFISPAIFFVANIYCRWPLAQSIFPALSP